MKLKNFSGYEIYPDEGKVWSYKRNRFVGRKDNNGNGYWKVTLTDDNGEHLYTQLHRIIWMSVNGEIPEDMEINHLDENKDNNSISNLSLCSRIQNIRYGSGIKRKTYKLSKPVGAYKNEVLTITFPSIREAERQGFCHTHISACCRGKLKSHKGYEWRFLS